MLAVAAVQFHYGGFVTIEVGIQPRSAERLGPVGSEPLDMVGAKPVTECMADYFVGHYPAMPRAGKTAQPLDYSDLSVRQTTMEKMMRRALALDEAWEKGSLHDFFISWEAGHAGAGGSVEKAREHFARSRELSAGQRVSPLVSYAESVLVSEQKKKEFEQVLNEAIAMDLTKAPPEQRLANVLAQRRAKWLLSRVDELF